MNRRGFLKGILAAGVAPYVMSGGVAAGVLMPVRSLWVPPPVAAWPEWQYGDYVLFSSSNCEPEIKDLALQQAREIFAALQVPDASDKIEWIEHAPGWAGTVDPLMQRGALGWKVSIPAPVWQLSMRDDPAAAWRALRKTKDPLLAFSWGGRTQQVPRGIVRDHARLLAARMMA